MDKKYIFLADYRAKLDDPNTLVIHAGSNEEYMKDAVAKAVIDGKEVEVSVVCRDNIRSRFCYKSIDIFFNREFQFLIPVPDKFRKLEFSVTLKEDFESQTVHMNILGRRYRKIVKNISARIDSVKKKNGITTITGWAADEENIDIKVINGNKPLECEVTRGFRNDIVAYYLDDECKHPAGFDIKIKDVSIQKVKVIFTTSDKRTVKHVNLKYETGQRKSQILEYIQRAIDYNKQYGFKVMILKAFYKLTNKNQLVYDKWLTAHEPSSSELSKQKHYKFDIQPKFSIIVPVYNPDEKYFSEMVKSVLNQTYSNWELCIADGGNSVQKRLKELVKNDSRVKYVALSENLGISGNSNKALELATGDYIVLGDHDDIIRPNALYECALAINNNPDADVIYSDEDKIDSATNKREQPNFKPDFSIDYLRSVNYICHLFVFSKEVQEKIGNFNSEFDGAQDYDLIFRCCEQAKHIIHIPKILYTWRMHSGSTSEDPLSKKYAFDAGKRAIAAHLDRVLVRGEVMDDVGPLGTYRVKYYMESEPKVSILIPNKDHSEDLDICIRSITTKQNYSNYEIIVIENNSTEKETFEYYKRIEKEFSCVKVVYWEHEFNYSKINNFGVQYATGEYLLLLNNDTEMINEDCLRELVSYGMRPEVGIVGAKLLYNDDTVQHAGVVVGLGGIAAHMFTNYKRDEAAYQGRAILAQNLSAVTAACLLTRKSVFDEVDGLDTTLQVAFNDIDYCLKVRDRGYLVVYNPFALLYHYESKSRGYEDTREKMDRFEREADYFNGKWVKLLTEGDPYYNVNLTLSKSDFSLRE